MALMFSVTFTSTPWLPTLDGVLLTDDNGGHGQLLLQPANNQSSYIEWDLERGEMTLRNWSPERGLQQDRRVYP